MPVGSDGLYHSQDPKYMGANDEGSGNSWYGDAYNWAKGAGNSIVDTMAGGGQTNVQQYQGWNENHMNANRDAQWASRANQQWLADQYRNRINGNAPSVAERQLAQTTAQNQQNQVAMARSGSGPMGNQAAQYNAMRNAANANQMAAGQGATMRAQEQMGAEQNYGNLVGQTRGQDQEMFGQERGWQTDKADSFNQWAGNQATADEQWKQRRGSGISGIVGGVGSVMGMGALM